MIIAAVGIFYIIFGGGLFTFDYMRDAAQEVIKDKDRARQVIQITDQANEEGIKFEEKFEKLSEQLVKMNQDYDLTHEEWDAFSEGSEKARTAFLDQYVELRFQISDLVTAEEWQAMHQVP